MLRESAKGGDVGRGCSNSGTQRGRAKGLIREGGSGRRAAIAKMVEGLGGKVEAFYFAFGDVDAYVVGVQIGRTTWV